VRRGSKASGLLLPILLLEFLGDEAKGSEDQTPLSSGRSNHYAAVPVPGVNPSLCLIISNSGLPTTDDFILHALTSALTKQRKLAGVFAYELTFK
jgi:hypothetical protein